MIRKTITLTIAILALTAATASADQPLCPQATGAANANPTAFATGHAPLGCAE